MARNLVCSDCNIMMEIGFIPDVYPLGAIQSIWVEGKPKIGFVEGIKNDFRKRKYYCITAYRCKKCGALKLFAESDLPGFK